MIPILYSKDSSKRQYLNWNGPFDVVSIVCFSFTLHKQNRYVFLGIYSCEMVIKAVAKGLVLDRLTYLRSPWNWLDFVVILSGYATLAVEIGNLAGLRTFRVLRALKTVSIIPGMYFTFRLPI